VAGSGVGQRERNGGAAEGTDSEAFNEPSTETKGLHEAQTGAAAAAKNAGTVKGERATGSEDGGEGERRGERAGEGK